MILFNGLRSKLFGPKEIVQVEQEEIKVDSIEDSSEVSSDELQLEKIELEEVSETLVLEHRNTDSIKAEYEDVISKLDSMASLVEDTTSEPNTLEQLQQEGNSILKEVNETTDIEQFVKEHKQVLIEDSENIIKNSDTYQINEGMFDLNSELHNAKLIISDTNIPTAITKEDVLHKSIKDE